MSLRNRRRDSYRQQPGFRQLGLESLEARLPLAADFHLLSDVNQTLEAISSNISSAVTIGGTTYFSANDGVSGRELWKSDGTPEGTGLLKDLRPGDSLFGEGSVSGAAAGLVVEAFAVPEVAPSLFASLEAVE